MPFDPNAYWRAVLAQDAAALRAFFHADATISWHCTNERFTAEEFIRANCEYPGAWAGELERVETAGDTVITAVRVYARESAENISFHAVSFLRIEDDKIRNVDEYWGDDGPAPGWRREMRIGRPLRAAD